MANYNLTRRKQGEEGYLSLTFLKKVRFSERLFYNEIIIAKFFIVHMWAHVFTYVHAYIPAYGVYVPDPSQFDSAVVRKLVLAGGFVNSFILHKKYLQKLSFAQQG